MKTCPTCNRILDETMHYCKYCKLLEEFKEENAYTDVNSPHFGKNHLSNNLSIYTNSGHKEYHASPSKSLISFVLCPEFDQCKIDTNSLPGKLHIAKSNTILIKSSHWLRLLPNQFINLLNKGQVSNQLYKSINKFDITNVFTTDFERLNIFQNGVIHYAGTNPFIYVKNDQRIFNFVNLIGFLWQFVYVSKSIYEDANYTGNITLLANLIGTEGTILCGYAKKSGDKQVWPDITQNTYKENCSEPNIQIKRDIHLAEATDQEIETLVHKAAEIISILFNHDSSPRCFFCREDNTKPYVFPEEQYKANNKTHERGIW